jgi:Ino eighty subunit 2
MDTINRLLKKQAPKRNRRAGAENLADGDEAGPPKASPLFVRYVSTRESVRVGVPEEWLGKPAGRVFEGPVPAAAAKSAPSTAAAGPRKMVEEVS